MAGVAVGTFLPSPSPTVLALLVGAGFACTLTAFVHGRSRLVATYLIVTFGLTGWALASSASARALRTPLRQWFNQQEALTSERDVFAIVEGVLREDGAPRPWGASLSVQVDRILLDGRRVSTAGGLRASVTGALVGERLDTWRAGRRVRCPVWLQRPSHYLDRGVPDDEVRLAWRGTTLVGSVKSAALVEVLAPGTWLDEAAAEVRQVVRRRVQTVVGRWNLRSSAIVTAILIGDRAGLDDSLQQRLQEAGTYHVIAISGGNIAILAALTLWTLRRLRLSVRPATCAAIVLLISYAWMVGAQSSVTRATLMAVIYLVGRLLDQRADPVNVLAIVMVVILCARPLSIADAGFALTCGATLAILVGAARFRAYLPSRAWLRAPAALFATSLCVEVALFPISAFVFSRVTCAGLVLNFLAIPLMTVAQIAGMAAVALSLVSTTLASMVGWFAHLGAWGLAESATLVDLAPWVSYRLPPPSPLALVIYYGAVGGWLFAATETALAMWPNGRARMLRRASGVVAASAAVWILVEPVSAATDALNRSTTLRVTFLDVGQGDSTLVQFPGGHSLLVDAGGGTETFDLGARVVAPALWASGVRQLDTLEITHGDSDHIGGAPSVFRDFTPRDVWYGVPVPPHELTSTMRAQAEAGGAVWRTLQAGDHVQVGGADLHVWHPPVPDWERQDVRNDDSIVIEIRFRGVSIVLPGDISREVERAIAPKFEPASLRIIKAAHHGSVTSSAFEFLDALRPKVVVFSSGRDNPFGHPAPPVVRRYQRIGATILRTDQDGEIELETDGTWVKISTYRGRKYEWRLR